jgi:hypothetical protein
MKKLLYLALVALVCTVFASFKTPGDSCPYEVALNGYKAMMGGPRHHPVCVTQH